MQYADSDLKNLVPLWQRELAHRVHQPVRDGFGRRNVNILSAPVGQNAVGNVGPLAQDVFGALIVRKEIIASMMTRASIPASSAISIRNRAPKIMSHRSMMRAARTRTRDRWLADRSTTVRNTRVRETSPTA